MTITEAFDEPGIAPGSSGHQPEDLVERVQELLARLGAIEDMRARRVGEELVGTLMELYGEGLERIVSALDASGERGREIRDALVADGIVGSLLLIHGLYPVDLEERVLEALEQVRPYLASHGGDVEFLGLNGDVARLRLTGSCDGCPASASTLELAIKQALEEVAPDLLGVEVEGIAEASPKPVGIGAPLPLLNGSEGQSAGPSWVELEGTSGLGSGGMTSLLVSGMRLLIANVGGTLLAYRDSCAACRTPLSKGTLSDGIVTCLSCERRFELPLAGRIVGGDEPLQLAPVPLLAQDGAVRVAVPA